MFILSFINPQYRQRYSQIESITFLYHKQSKQISFEQKFFSIKTIVHIQKANTWVNKKI